MADWLQHLADKQVMKTIPEGLCAVMTVPITILVLKSTDSLGMKVKIQSYYVLIMSKAAYSVQCLRDIC